MSELYYTRRRRILFPPPEQQQEKSSAMTIALDLNAEEERVLRLTAEAAAADIPAVLHGLIAQLLPPEPAASAAPEPSDDPESSAERRREQEEVEANIKRWHEERGLA